MSKGASAAFAIALACLPFTGCSAAAQDAGGFLRNLFYGGAPPPPPGPPAAGEEVDCPPVTVANGGAALRAYTGGRTGAAESLRHQISIANVGRECRGQGDGSVVVKVGVEGRALLGPAGSAGRFQAPVHFVIRRGDQVLVNRARSATVTLAAGQTQGSFVIVEEGMVVPAGTGEFEIEVGLGGSGAAARPTRGARR
ncbi:MAG TPA: hypothetical protein VH743_15135 [Beijerinckiaceae bacterium]|jgi:hypothetical protein